MRAVAVALLLTVLAAPPVLAQIIPTRPPTQQQQTQQQQPDDPADTIPVPAFREDPPVTPTGAALRSLILPGWGQSIAGRRATGAVFIFWEGLTLTMTIKAFHQKDYQERVGSEAAEDKGEEVQDWWILLAFNHLLAAAEAYVATNLWDFPATITTETLPSGDVGAGLKVYW